MYRLLFCFLISAIAARSGSPLAGTWLGKMNDQPAVEITIQDSDGKLTGEVGFYFQQLENGKWNVKGKYSAPMLVPNLDADGLVFEVQHHRCHGCKELGPNKTYRIQLTAANESRLNEVGVPQSGKGLLLVRMK